MYTVKTVEGSLQIFTGMIETMKVNKDIMKQATKQDNLKASFNGFHRVKHAFFIFLQVFVVSEREPFHNRVCDGKQHDAAEEKPRHGGADPR
jgi:hypothetical protein